MQTNSTPVPARLRSAIALIIASALMACAPADHGANLTRFDALQDGIAMPTARDAGMAITYFGTEFAEAERALAAKPIELQPQAF